MVSPTVDTLERLLRACGMELEPIDQPGENDVDRTLIWENLRITPAQRARLAALQWNQMEPFRRGS